MKNLIFDSERNAMHMSTRIYAIETKADQTVNRVNQNTAWIQDLHNQLENDFSKIDDLENRSRRYNLGGPWTFKDTDQIVRSFIKELITNNPDHRLEMDRAHRALQPPCQDGPPRDIIVNPYFYKVKEEVMHHPRAEDSLAFQGHPIQIFANLSPYTIQKRRSLKPLLQVLTQKSITYRCSFPFRLSFSLNN